MATDLQTQQAMDYRYKMATMVAIEYLKETRVLTGMKAILMEQILSNTTVSQAKRLQICLTAILRAVENTDLDIDAMIDSIVHDLETNIDSDTVERL